MQEVTLENLIQGKEYWMECFSVNNENQFLPYRRRYKMIARFDKYVHTAYDDTTNIYFTNFRTIKYRNNKNYGYDVTLSDYCWKFYEILKEKVQKDMESRAYDMVLRQKIRDEYFEYCAF